MTAQSLTADRLRTYRGLVARNRIVAILRIGVPVLGVVVLVGLVGQIYLSSLGNQFGIERISVTPERVTAEAPQYAGVLEDGSVYHVSAASAAAALTSRDVLDLTDAALRITRINGVTMDITSQAAQLDTTHELVTIEGTTRVVESTGTTSVLDNSVFDWAAHTLTSQGPVTVDYADGTQLVAKGLVYDAKAMVWTFSGATVTLAQTPGAQTP